MKFLKQFWTALVACFLRLIRLDRQSFTASEQTSERDDSHIGELTDPQSVLARFLFQSNHFKNNRPVPQVFLPPPDLKLSVFQIDGITTERIWSIGRKVLESHPRPRLYGRADFDIEAIKSQKLKGFRDDDPPRHVNVVGWPSYETGKDLIMNMAQELARRSRLELLSSPISK